MTRQEIIKGLKLLNKHYKLKVKFKTGYPLIGDRTPVADIRRQTLIFPPMLAFYNERILAHEFAHILVCKGHQPLWGNIHNEEFESSYRECCLVLGIFPIPTKDLNRETEANLEKEALLQREEYCKLAVKRNMQQVL